MIVVVLATLAIADIILILAFLRLQKKLLMSQNIVRELSEERSMLGDLRASVRAELASAQAQARQIKDQVQVLATEAEQEVRRGISNISRETESIVATISSRLEAPLVELNNKQHFLVKLAKDAENQRELLGRIVSRAETAAKLLHSASNWQDIVDELESRRFHDIRAMLAKGLSAEKIARELGVPESEVRVVSGTL